MATQENLSEILQEDARIAGARAANLALELDDELLVRRVLGQELQDAGLPTQDQHTYQHAVGTVSQGTEFDYSQLG